jgi:hypothetical protein
VKLRILKSFPNHAGRPGLVGGSLPKGESSIADTMREKFHVNTKVIYMDEYLPDVHGEHISEAFGVYDPDTDTIMISNKRYNECKDDANFQHRFGDVEEYSIFNDKSYTVQMPCTAVYGPDAIVIHEMVHAMDIKKGYNQAEFSSSFECGKIYSENYQKYKYPKTKEDAQKCISKYSLGRQSEFFAEAVTAYILDPKWLRTAQPNLYDYVEKCLEKNDSDYIIRKRMMDLLSDKEFHELEIEIATSNGEYKWVRINKKELKSFPNHEGRPGLVGGSLPKGNAYNSYDSLNDLIKSGTTKNSTLIGFYINVAEQRIFALSNPSMGGHERLAEEIANDPKYSKFIDKDYAEKYNYEMAAYAKGDFVRCEYSITKKAFYVQSIPFSTKQLHAVQKVLLGADNIETIRIDGYTTADSPFDPKYSVVHNTEIPFQDFIVADKVYVTNRQIMLKSFPNHEGRPGMVGGSLPKDYFGAKDNAELTTILLTKVKDGDITFDQAMSIQNEYISEHASTKPFTKSSTITTSSYDDIETILKLPDGTADRLRHLDKVEEAWIKGADSEGKHAIMDWYDQFPELKTARLYQMYEIVNPKTSFEEFIHTPITLYRGGSAQGLFSSYTLSKSTAEHFANQYGVKIHSIDIKPYDLIGFSATGATEAFVPNQLKELKQLPVDPTSIRNLVSARLGLFNNAAETLAERMFTGDLTIGAWEEAMKAEIRALHSSLAAIGKGGWDNMTWSDWGKVGSEVKKQYRYLHGFADDIAAERDTMSLAKIRARAQMYGDAARHTAFLMQAKDFLIHLPWIPGDGSTECLTHCKCFWQFTTSKPKNGKKQVTAVWRLRPAEHCRDCIPRNGHTIVFNVDEDIDVPTYVGDL